jgi:hypothetical protein
MGGKQDGDMMQAVQPLKNLPDFQTHARIEIPRRFIGEEHHRVIDQRSRSGHARLPTPRVRRRQGYILPSAQTMKIREAEGIGVGLRVEPWGSEDKHGVTITIKTVPLCDRLSVSRENSLTSCQAHGEEQRG